MRSLFFLCGLPFLFPPFVLLLFLFKIELSIRRIGCLQYAKTWCVICRGQHSFISYNLLFSLMSLNISGNFSNSRKTKLILTIYSVFICGYFSGSWLLSGRLSKMLLIDCEQNDCQLTLSGMSFSCIDLFMFINYV